MGKRTGKKNVSSFLFRKSRSIRRTELEPQIATGVATEAQAVKGAKKKSGSRLWMRLDRAGKSEVTELDKSAIIRMASVPARDLRILGPIFSHSSNIVAREKAMIVNLEFIKAIITAEEVLLLDPLCHEVLPFIEQLRQQIHLKSPSKARGVSSTGQQWLHGEGEGDHQELPFEFQVLEISLEFVCSYLDSSVSNLEGDAYPALDELAKIVSTKNLERVRSLKSNLTRLLARVQKVRDEIEHLLDDDEDLRQLCLTRKQIQNHQFEALMASSTSNSFVFAAPNPTSLNYRVRGSSSLATFHSDENHVEGLEMLLEAYFMQLEGTRNKILSVREYIDDTEDYLNIQLDHQRNELIQLQLVLSSAAFAIALNTLMVGFFAMNIPCPLYHTGPLFSRVVGGTTGASLLFFLLIVAFARWRKLLGP